MHISRHEQTTLANSLTSSIDIKTMTYIARTLVSATYNIHERTGYPASISIPKRDAVIQIIQDIIAMNLYLEFIAMLIDIQESGYKGTKFTIINLRNIVEGVLERGYLYEKDIGRFVENPAVRISGDWGFLQSGTEYTITFLRIDLVKNTELVKNNPKEIVEQTYSDIKTIVQKTVESRNGRLWSWEGDGGIAAFVLSSRHQAATLSAIDILHQLTLYCGTSCKLSDPLAIRMAVHNGPYEHTGSFTELNKSETIQQLTKIEHEYTKPNTITISIVVRNMLDDIIARQFELIEDFGHYQYFTYTIRWES